MREGIEVHTYFDHEGFGVGIVLFDIRSGKRFVAKPLQLGPGDFEYIEHDPMKRSEPTVFLPLDIAEGLLIELTETLKQEGIRPESEAQTERLLSDFRETMTEFHNANVSLRVTAEMLKKVTEQLKLLMFHTKQ